MVRTLLIWLALVSSVHAQATPVPEIAAGR